VTVGPGTKILRLTVALTTSAALAIGGVSASAAPGRTGAGSWIVLGSDRDGSMRAYSMRIDGSRLKPLLSSSRALAPRAVSARGDTIAYEGGDALYVSRADGTRLRRLVRGGVEQSALSHDGKLVAFRRSGASGIWILGTDGRGLRRAPQATNGFEPDWSPDGTALVFTTRDAIVVQPLRGSRRLVVRGDFDRPKWSRDGRWIAYRARRGLEVVRTTGKERHRVASGQVFAFAWSPDSRRLAVTVGLSPDVAIVGVDGHRVKALRLGLAISSVTWSLDGHLLVLGAHAGDDPDQIWVVRQDGRALRRLTSAGANTPIGWTRVASRLAPAASVQPSERVSAADAVATRASVAALSADGTRVAFIPSPTATDCDHVSVWTPAARSIVRLSPSLPAPCTSRDTGSVRYTVYDLALAGSRVAWAEVSGCGNYCDVMLKSATLARPRRVIVSFENGGGGAGGGELWDFHLHGHGDLLVFDDDSRLVRIGVGSEQCQERGDYGTSICATLRRGAHVAPAESVSGSLIAIREPDAVAVIDATGALVRLFPFTRNDVTAARLDGGRLVVARPAVLETFDVASGAREQSLPLPSGSRLDDADGGIAVLRRGDGTIMLLRFTDGRSFTLAPGATPRFADLEPPGLYHSYAIPGAGGRIVFMPRAEVVRRLDIGS
jgi:Tol biopolymer transport system component